MAYAGSNREAVLSLLTPVFSDPKSSMEVVGMAGLACGMIAVGSCNPDVTATIVQTLMEKSETELHDTYARFLPLGLGLCHLGEFTFTSSACMLCYSFSGRYHWPAVGTWPSVLQYQKIQKPLLGLKIYTGPVLYLTTVSFFHCLSCMWVVG